MCISSDIPSLKRFDSLFRSTLHREYEVMQVAAKRKVRFSNVDQVTLRRRGIGLIAHDPSRAVKSFTLIAPQTDERQRLLIAMNGTVARPVEDAVPAGRHAVPAQQRRSRLQRRPRATADIYPAWMLWHGVRSTRQRRPARSSADLRRPGASSRRSVAAQRRPPLWRARADARGVRRARHWRQRQA